MRRLSVRLRLNLAVGLLALIALCAASAVAWRAEGDSVGAQAAHQANATADLLLQAAGNLAVERGLTNTALSAPPAAATETRSAIGQRRATADAALATTEVDRGVRLVDDTGQALTRIVVQVGEITGSVAGIAAAAREQSTGLQELNSAVNQMDQVMQQNAAMVEETSAASQALAQETTELMDLTDRFQVDATEADPASPAILLWAARPAPLKLAAHGGRHATAAKTAEVLTARGY